MTDAGLLGIGHQDPQVGQIRGAVLGSARPVEGFGKPTETPQLGDTVADPHRNPTDETAQPDTLVMRVKGTENSR